MALPVPNACAERYHPVSSSYRELFLCQRSFTAEESTKHFIKRKLHTTHVELRAGNYAMLMSPNKGETAAYGCLCPGNVAVRMR